MSSIYPNFAVVKSALASGKLSVQSLVAHYLERIAARTDLNAFVEVFSQEAHKQAIVIDEKIAQQKAGKLAGMIIGIKDNICYQGHVMTASSKILGGFVSLFSATAVERLLAEDAIIIGRLNCDEFAMGASNETSYYGPVRNAADKSKVSGGSSGGSAVAVQAGLCLASLGSDTGGSIRQPAAFCGVLGLKPSYGRVSRHGLTAFASSCDCIGPLANTAQDIALLLEVMAGPDDYDATVSRASVPAYSQALNQREVKERPLKFAYLPETLESPGLDPEIKALVNTQIAGLKAAGHVVEAASFPYLDYVVPAYYVLTAAEASSNLARYDGLRFGYRSPKASDLESVYKLSRSEGFGAEVKRRILLGTFVLSAGYYEAYYTKAQKVRRLIRDHLQKILTAYDCIILPTTPSTAWPLGSKITDPVQMYLADIFTVSANLAGLPAISLPMATHSNGLSIGIQLMGSYLGEQTLLQASSSLMANRSHQKE